MFRGPLLHPIIYRIYVHINRLLLSRKTNWIVSRESLNRWRSIPSDHAVLLASNHADHEDHFAFVELAGQLYKFPYEVSAPELFDEWGGWKGLGLRLIGAFPVQRGGSDIDATRFVIKSLTDGKTIAIFPEGEVHFLNDVVTPLMRGLSLFALEGARARERAGKTPESIVVLPMGIKYFYPYDATSLLKRKLDFCERQLFGRASRGPVFARIENLLETMLARASTRFGVHPEGPTIEHRFLDLARQLSTVLEPRAETSHEKLFEHAHRQRVRHKDDAERAEMARWAAQAIDFWPGYIEETNQERLMETLRKSERLITGREHPEFPGRRNGCIEIGRPIPVHRYLAQYLERKSRNDAMETLTRDVTAAIQTAIDGLRQRNSSREGSRPGVTLTHP